jgi:hypothetical protein
MANSRVLSGMRMLVWVRMNSPTLRSRVKPLTPRPVVITSMVAGPYRA